MQTCFQDILGSKTPPDPSGGVIGQMDRVMDPPGAVIEIKVVVRIRGVDPKGGFHFRCLLHYSG